MNVRNWKITLTISNSSLELQNVEVSTSQTFLLTFAKVLKGDKGDAGIGIPTGGSEGQVLTKNSGTNYDTKWSDPVADFDDLTNRPKYNGSDITHETNIPEVKTSDWDGKQNALSASQLAAANSGVTAAKVGEYDAHVSSEENPHSVTKAQVGLGNVPNTDFTTRVETLEGKTKLSDFTDDLGSSPTHTHSQYITEHQSLYEYRKSSAQDVIDAGKISEPTSEGTNGQVLTTDGQGGRVWTTVQGGGGGATGAVRYDQAQTLTDAQKEQARANIRAQELDVELVTITLTCEDEGVSTAGVDVTRTEDGVSTTYTSDANGQVGFSVKRGHEYTVSYGSFGQYNPPATATYTANAPVRAITSEYRGLSAICWGVKLNQDMPNICQGLVGDRSLWTTWQNKIGRYLLKPDGTAKKLKSDDSTKYVDGTAIDETEGDVMVRIPKFYYKVNDNGDGTLTLWGSEQQQTGFYEMSEQWIGAYLGYITENKLRSRSGYNPTRSNTIQQFHDAAKILGSNYGLADYKARQTMMMLFMWKYNTTNSQDPNCMGYGMTGSGSNWTTEVQNELTGRTATLGDTCGGVAFTATGTLASHTSLYGLEDTCCWFFEMTQGVYFGSSSNTEQDGTEVFIYEGNRIPTSQELITHPEGSYRQLTRLTNSGYPKTMPLVSQFDLFATSYGGSSGSYWYDYCYASATGQLLLFGGSANYGSFCGLVCVHSNYGFPNANSDIAARLAYYGDVTID